MIRSKMLVAGLLLLGLLSIGDVLAPVLTDGQTPPMSIALMASGLGLTSLACVYVIFAAGKGSRPALAVLVATRGVSALSAVPAFLVPEVPRIVQAMAGAGIALTVVGVVLTLGGRRSLVNAR